MNAFTVALCCALAAALFTGSEALSCWTCDSTTTSGCDEYNFSPSSATSQSNCNYCQKLVTSVSLLGFSSTAVSRNCVSTCTPGDVNLVGRVSTYCCADKEKCNSASTTRLALTTAGVLLALTFVIRQLF